MTVNMKEIRTKTKEDINALLKTTIQDMEKVMKSIMNGEEKNLGKPGKIRKDIARIKTVIAEMEVENA